MLHFKAPQCWPSVPNLTNAWPNTTAIHYGTQVQFTCNDTWAYVFQPGNTPQMTIKCMENMQWQPTISNCVIRNCIRPNTTFDLTYATFNPDLSAYNNGSSLNYTCNAGYALIDGNTSITASCINFTWIVNPAFQQCYRKF